MASINFNIKSRKDEQLASGNPFVHLELETIISAPGYQTYTFPLSARYNGDERTVVHIPKQLTHALPNDAALRKEVVIQMKSRVKQEVEGNY